MQDVVLIGDSLIEQIIPERLIHSSRNVRVSKLEAFHLDDIHNLADSPNVSKAYAAAIHCETVELMALNCQLLMFALKRQRR